MALLSVLLFFLAAPPWSYNGENILSVFNLSVISDMGQITVANHSEHFVSARLKCLIGDFFPTLANSDIVGHRTDKKQSEF